NYQFAVPPTLILLFILMAVPFILEGGDSPRPQPARRRILALRVPLLSRTAVKIGASAAILFAATMVLRNQVRLLESEWRCQAAADFERLGKRTAAEMAFRQSVASNDTNGRAHFGLSRVLEAQGDLPGALKEVTAAEKTFADSHQEILRS